MKSATISTLALALLITVPALQAAEQSTKAQKQMQRQDISEVRKQTVKASDVLRGSITNGLNPMGTIQDLVLDENASRVQYVIFNAGVPWTLAPGPGYLSFNVVDLERGSGLYGVDVRTDFDGEVKGPQELQITRGEADYRLASRIIGSQLAFDEGKVHEVEDFLIDLQTGQVTHFIIGTEEGFFSSDLRAVPADQISVKAGSLGTDLAFATVEEMEPYDTDVFW